jgi:hypothetical protein
MTVPLIFDFKQRNIEPRRRDAFDKIGEIKTAALLLAFPLQEIKEIKEIKRETAAPEFPHGPAICENPGVFSSWKSRNQGPGRCATVGGLPKQAIELLAPATRPARRANFDHRTEGTGSRVAPPPPAHYKSRAVHAEERCASHQ